MTARKPSGDTSQNGCACVVKLGFTVRMPMPALLTSTSRPPRAAAAACTPASTASSSRTSKTAGHTPAAAPPRSVTTALTRSGRRPFTATAAPAAARACAMARPRPSVDPVTRTRTPVRSAAAMSGTLPTRASGAAGGRPRGLAAGGRLTGCHWLRRAGLDQPGPAQAGNDRLAGNLLGVQGLGRDGGLGDGLRSAPRLELDLGNEPGGEEGEGGDGN